MLSKPQELKRQIKTDLKISGMYWKIPKHIIPMCHDAIETSCEFRKEISELFEIISDSKSHVEEKIGGLRANDDAFDYWNDIHSDLEEIECELKERFADENFEKIESLITSVAEVYQESLDLTK